MESLGRSSQLAEPTIVVGAVELHLDNGQAVAAGRPVWFTRREFEVLRCLMLAAGRPVSNDEIHQAVWGPPVAGFKDRSVEVHIVRIRRKLAAASPNLTYIHTHHRVGCRFDPVAGPPPVRRRRQP
jgi:DNA-binding response OmpR family regulator